MAVCPVCGDQVVNGRCRFCGMPYRNDEAMYHLNESSHDHYRHASSDVKKKMREAAVPLGDRNQPRKHPVSRAEMQAKQQQIRQEAMKKMTTTASSAHTAKPARETINLNGKNKKVSTKKTTYASTAGKELAGKKKKSSGRWIWIMIILFILISNVENLMPLIRSLIYRLTGSSAYSEVFYYGDRGYGDDFYDDENEETYAELLEELKQNASLVMTLMDGNAVVIDEDSAYQKTGDYLIQTDRGTGKLYIYDSEEDLTSGISPVEILRLTDDDPMEYSLFDGNVIQAKDMQYSTASVNLYLMDSEE